MLRRGLGLAAILAVLGSACTIEPIYGPDDFFPDGGISPDARPAAADGSRDAGRIMDASGPIDGRLPEG